MAFNILISRISDSNSTFKKPTHFFEFMVNFNMQDRRAHKRYTVDNFNIRGNILFISDIEIINISLNGIAIQCDRRIELNKLYTLSLKYEGKEINIKGRVVWSMITGSRLNTLGEMVPIYQAGLEFVDVLAEKMSDLVNFIESHKIENDKRLAGIRFHIKSPEMAKLENPYTCKVKKISLSGMLIESTQALGVGEKLPVELYLGDSVFKCTGRVASCSKVNIETSSHYDVGIAFTDVSTENQEILNTFISRLSD